jgi:hypothetical protein
MACLVVGSLCGQIIEVVEWLDIGMKIDQRVKM